MPLGESDGVPVVQFDPGLEISPFIVLRRVRAGQEPMLVDLRERPELAWTLEGARPVGADWRPDDSEAERDIILIDDRGTDAVERARALQAEGYGRVRALFGGIELWRFSLDPDIVGEDTLLRPLGD